MDIKDLLITKIQTKDIRFPTSKTSQGSDSLHTNPNYSTCYVKIHAKTKHQTLESHGIIFTIGKGTDIVAKCVSDLAYIIEHHTLGEIISQFPTFISRLANEPQLRWLGPQKGVVHLATSGIINALWDLWGKAVQKPLWLLLSELSSEQIISMLDFSYITDELSKQEALKILKDMQLSRKERISFMQKNGMPAYTTAVGWSGYSQQKVRSLANDYLSQGFTHFKVKVGLGTQRDTKRCELMRECIGYDKCHLMMDANQIWGVDEAIENMNALAKFKPLWIEEPTAPDDVIGHLKISKAIKPIGVATGEHAHNRILHKHFASMGAYQFCQSDPCRVAGMNELILVMIMAKKFNIPVCLHTGGVGLCEMGIHAAIFDFVGICGTQDKRITEYSGALHQHFVNPVVIKNGKYVAPQGVGYASDLTDQSIQEFSYPDGSYWRSEGFLDSFKPFQGIMSPPFIPLSADGNSVNVGLIEDYAQVLVKQGVSGAWVNGSSGQFASLTKEERMSTVEAWVNTSHHKNGQIRLISHIACNSIIQSIQLAKHSEKLKVFALAISCPSYYKPEGEKTIAEWIHAIAKEVPSMPIYYYHIPKFNNVQSTVYQTLTFARKLSPNVVGAKFTDSRLDDLALCKSAGFNMLVGADTMFVNALACGVDGLIGISTNFMGRKFRDIFDILKGNENIEECKSPMKAADDIQAQIRSIFEGFKLDGIGMIQICKWLMFKLWGLDFGPVRLPFIKLTQEQKQVVAKEVVQKYF